jgi:aspartyl-tRNA(Asn)/glutamyl-tRNA(Gln) amidotransferase subunit B
VTVLQRVKEDADDYRYFPEPDLPPLVVSREWVERIRASLPELPDARRARFVRDFGLSAYDADQLTSERAMADYYEAVMAAGAPADRATRAKLAANWTLGDLRRLLNAAGTGVTASKLTAAGLAELLDLIDSGAISGKQAKDVLETSFTTGASPKAVVASEGISQLSDASELEASVAAVIAENPKAVEDYRAGKASAVQFLMGQVMKRTKGRARPDVVTPLLLSKLDQG